MSYYKDGELIKFEYDNPESKYDLEMANEYNRFYAMLKNKVWDIEYGPGGSGDVIVKWKREEDGSLKMPNELSTWVKDF